MLRRVQIGGLGDAEFILGKQVEPSEVLDRNRSFQNADARPIQT